jgi:hypothetical protein
VVLQHEPDLVGDDPTDPPMRLHGVELAPSSGPVLRLIRRRAVLTFACLTAEQRGLEPHEVEAVA